MRSRRPIALLLAMLVVAPACAQDAKRSGDDPRAITRTRTRLTWTGTSAFRSSPPRPSDLRQLRSAGQSFTFDVALGNDYWKRRPGSLHVGIRWTERGGQVSQDVTGDLFALFVVDPNDDIVAGIRGDDRDISSAQSVELNAPPDGKYEVLVVPHRVRGRRFEGVVTVKHATTSDVLPDLAPRQPDGFTFKAQGAEDSCLLVEVQEQPGLRRCLRFDARISNVGEGAFVTEADITDEVDRRSGGLEPEGDVVQIVEGQDGKRRRIPTGRWVIDKEHAHTHLVDLASYELRRVTTAGAGDPLVTDVKIGFCPWDLIDERFGRSTATERRFP
ncbi:MAG TPA: hypothetical protein VFA34_02590, partial [Actinomycetota bacterium]|nr:hypothetical protein [Actinomycetota bacterium]